jgi:DNA-binding CsgD family transcriptional regulator
MEPVGRERELDEVTSLLDRDRADAPRVLLIEGEPGIGKTTLWRAGVEEAQMRGYRVLAGAAAGSEAKLAFTTLRDLLSEVFDEVAADLPAPQQSALEVMLLRAAPRGSPPDPATVAVGFLTTLQLLAATAPTLVAVDDIQWLDTASSGPLSYALRRLGHEPILGLLARRTGERPDGLGLDRLSPEQLLVVEVGALSVGALGKILHERLGAVFPRPTLQRLHAVSGGNPFYALELARALGDVREPIRPGMGFPVPGSLRELIEERIAALPPDTFEAIAAASSLARPTLQLVGAAGGRDADDALTPAVEAGIVEVRGTAVAFTHPLYAAVVYDLASPGAATRHARLAEMVADVEERARHLALATTAPDEHAAGALEAAAHAASSRGGAAAAAELAEAAYRLTPADDTTRRSLRALDAGWFQFIVGDAKLARTLLEEAERMAPPGELRARARTRLGWLEHHAGDRRLAIGRYTAALDDTTDPSQRAQIFSLLAWSYAIMREDAASAARYARQAVDLCDAGIDDPALLVDSLSVLAQAEFFLGGGLPSAAMERALALPPDDTDLRVLRRPTNHWALMLLCADRFDEARPLFEDVLALAHAAGDESAVPWPLMRLAQLHLATGRWDVAQARAQEGLEAAVQTGQAPVRADLTCTWALVLAHLGRADEARTTVSEGMELAEASSSGIGARLGGWALGMLDLVLGDAHAAATRLGALWERSKHGGILDPGENRYLGDLGQALVLNGDLAAAERLGNELGSLGARLGRASASGTALRIRGLAAAARDDLDRAQSLLEEAVSHHESAGLPFQLGRTVLALGATQRRARHRRDARATLQRALGIFDSLDAAQWAEQAQAELTRIGGRAPSEGGLTPTEDRVAALVASGKTNKEVASALVVSVHTVEAALTSIYRKLDIRSRTELAHKLTEESKH